MIIRFKLNDSRRKKKNEELSMINCHKCQVLIADGKCARCYSASSLLFHTAIRMRIPSLLFVHLGRQNGVYR
jgi:hypothetical protein